MMLHWGLQPQGRKACSCVHSPDLPWGSELGWSEVVPLRAGPACAHRGDNHGSRH